MAAEPSNALTMQKLMKIVAEKLGIGDYRSTGQLHIPVDQYNFDLCKQYIDNGITMFMSDAPLKGWRWMRRPCSVTFATRVTGTVDSASTTTLVDVTLVDTYDSDDDLNGWWVYILTGTGIGSYAQITDYNGTTGACTVAAWLNSDGNLTGTTPAASDTFAITSVKTIGGDAARYVLPANFGGELNGPIEYQADSSRATLIEWCDESEIRALRATSVSSGPPSRAAVRPYQPVDETLCQSRLWELIVDPEPSNADTIEFPYTLYFDGMKMESGIATGGTALTLVDSARTEANDYFNGWLLTIIDGTGVGETATITDYTGSSGTFTFTALSGGSTPDATSEYIVEPVNNLHPAGHQFDDVVKAACLARTEMESQDEHFDTFWTDYYHKKALLNAYRIDARSAPRKLGPLLKGRGSYRYGRSWNDVTTDHDV